jgi:large subunit ribosomal protein L47
MRRKYEDLKKGKDNLSYIEDAVKNKQKHAQLLNHLREKYDYKNKKVVYPNSKISKEELEEMKNSGNFIVGFESQIEEQIKEGRRKVDKYELLRSHIRNYHMLTQKEKRTVLGYIGARRGRDARKEFRKELSLLAQKIAYENKQKEEMKM